MTTSIGKRILRTSAPAFILLLFVNNLGLGRYCYHNIFPVNEQQDPSLLPPQAKGETEQHSKSIAQQFSKASDAATIDGEPLNVILLYTDDMRYDLLSGTGTQLVQTPFLDRLAARGIKFTHSAVTTSVCWISRATLMTGQYLARHRSNTIRNPVFYDSWNTTWPHILQSQKDYYVGHIGKWHFSQQDRVASKFNFTRIFEFKHWLNIKGKKTHVTDHTENMAIEFLKTRPKDKPFAATVAFYPPKGISDRGLEFWHPKPESMALYENDTIAPPFDVNGSYARLPTFFGEQNTGRQTYYYSFGNEYRLQHNSKQIFRMITEVDQACANIVAELEQQGVLNKTMIIFTADNGFMHGDQGMAGKWYPFEGSIRVPHIVWDPRMSPSLHGTSDPSFTLNVDLAPTILGAAGLDTPPSMQGRDVAQLYLNASLDVCGPQNKSYFPPWRDEFYYEHPSLGGEGKIPQSSALVRKDFKLMRYNRQNVETFFNVAADPMELVNSIGNPVYSRQVDEMKRRYLELKEHVEAGGSI